MVAENKKITCGILKITMAEKVLFAWSGGKDSALALYELQQTQRYDVVALLTTVTKDYERISMHGVSQILLEQQADSLGLPLEKIFISKNSSNEEYETRMREVLTKYKETGVSSVVFGDIFLESVKQYREDNLEKAGMKGIFPLWGKDTSKLACAFIDLCFKAVITCVDSHMLDKRFAGRAYDKQFLSELHPNTDPCGEKGEFHSFVYDGPLFRESISCTRGDILLRDNRFYYCDLIPGQEYFIDDSDNTGCTAHFVYPNPAMGETLYSQRVSKLDSQII